MNTFVIVVPVYNSELWIEGCISSILAQDYRDYELLVIDDHSTDRTWQIIESLNVSAIRNREHCGSALQNIVKGIGCYYNRQDIIVPVDGDDALANESVLTHLNEVYNEDVWLTWGSFLPVSGRYSGTCQELAETHTVDESGKWVTNHLTTQTYRRSGVWVTSHLRTFKRWLWDNIDNKDLRDESGQYFKLAWDLAFMYPMIEMAGTHIRYIEKILYIYNDLNPNCDGTIDPQLQIRTGKFIQSKPVYKPL